MNQRGFTLIEILMVIMLVAILAAVSIPQFVDFRGDAKNAATQSAVGTLRTAIMNQYSQSLLRCNAKSGQYPTLAQVSNNDITNGGSPCTTSMVSLVAERQFVAGNIPDNPWGGGTTKNTVTACSGVGCNNAGKACDGNDFTTASTGWCYDASTGKIWANSNNSSQNEHTF